MGEELLFSNVFDGETEVREDKNFLCSHCTLASGIGLKPRQFVLEGHHLNQYTYSRTYYLS